MELVVSPITHTRGGLTPVQALDIIIASKVCIENELAKKPVSPLHPSLGKIRVGIIVYVSCGRDGPVAFRKCAKLAIAKKEQSGVCGFGVFGERDIEPESFNYFNESFNLLKSHEINVAMSAGNNNEGSVLHAIHEAGASRISGGFRAHKFPRLMNYMATYNIPVEMAFTDKLKAHIQDIRSFGSTPIRLFSDNGIPVAICSFRSSFNMVNRVQMWTDAINNCQYSVPDALILLSNGFMYNFQKFDTRKKMYEEFYEAACAILKSNGFTHLFKVPFVGPNAK